MSAPLRSPSTEPVAAPPNGAVAVCPVAPDVPAKRRLWVKDNIATAALPTRSATLAATGAPSRDATVVERALAAGYALAGKAALDELAMGTTGRTGVPGPTHNPAASDRLVGGSSSGSAALVAAGHGVALGTDTGGSVRLPAAFAGIVGMRPTFGRVSCADVLPMAPSLDTVGPMGPDVASTAALFAAIAGPDARDPRCVGPARAAPTQLVPRAVRIALLEHDPRHHAALLDLGLLDPDPTAVPGARDAASGAAARTLATLGVTVHLLPAPDRPAWLAAYATLACAEAVEALADVGAPATTAPAAVAPAAVAPAASGAPATTAPAASGARATTAPAAVAPAASGAGRDPGSPPPPDAAVRRARTATIGIGVQKRLVYGAWVRANPDVHTAAIATRAAATAFYADLFERYDFVLEPATPRTAPLVSDADRPELVADLDLYFVGASLAGLPALVLPAPRQPGDTSPPVAVHLTAAPNRDEALFALAELLESNWR